MNKQKIKTNLGVIIISIFIITLYSFTILAASGDVDTSFNASTYSYPGGGAGSVSALARQTDGKILVGGSNFEIVNSRLRNTIFRLNADYSLDTTFNPSRVTGQISSIGLQSDGKIIIAGVINVDGILVTTKIIRLNQDGSVDNTFNLPTMPNTNFPGAITKVNVRPDDKILIGGSFAYVPASGSAVRNGIARLNSNGTTDESFVVSQTLGVFDIEVQPDGKILGAFSFDSQNKFLKRLNSDGTLDDNFNVLITTGSGGLSNIKIQSDGKILISGSFTNVNNFPRNNLARLNSDGTLDEGFTANTSSTINDLECDVNGKILVASNFNVAGETRFSITRLNNNGSLDLNFNFPLPTATSLTVRNIMPLPDGRIIIGGDGFRFGRNGGQVYLLEQNGSVNPSFNVFIGNRGYVWDITVQNDGKILLGGDFTVANSTPNSGIVRLNSDGNVDTTFNPNLAISNFAPIVGSISVQTDGKIIVGERLPGRLIRLNENGSPDAGFTANIDSNAFIYDTHILPDGKIIAAGDIRINSLARRIARFNSNGSLDTTFQPQQNFPDDSVFKVIVQSDGKLLICGAFNRVGTTTRGRIARLNSDGSLDTSFNPLGGANNLIYDMGVQSDGKIVIVGIFTNVNGTNKQFLARLNPNGTLDNSFTVNADATLSSVKIQPDGKILIGGSFANINGFSSRGLARLRADGTFDPTFNVGTGTNGPVLVFESQADNKLLIGGNFTLYNNNEKLSVARLLNNPNAVRRTPFDFDGDGRSDVSVFRGSTNRWYEILSGNSSVSEATFGISGDVVSPADFDGDGKTDLAIFRPSTGSWWYLSSVDNTQKSVQFGASGDIPRPSDVDGDGRDDFVVFRPSNNAWYRLSSNSGAVSVLVFGTSGDKPLVGDFDGDGKSDVAIFRPSTGTWWYQSSINNAQIATTFGISTDIPVPADFDGDGKTDFAVYRPSTGVWYILNSSTGQATIVGFGISEDKPVAADYDGDGKADIAVFRPSTGIWYLLRSGQGFTALQFGISTDIPIPNSFVP